MKKEIDAEFVGCAPEMSEQAFGPRLKLYEELGDFVERQNVVGSDAMLCLDFLQKMPHNQFWRRNLIKSVVVLIEANCYGLKRIANYQQAVYEVTFSAAELALLKEEKYILDDKGDVIVEDKNFQRFIPNIRFALKSFSKAYGIPFNLDMSQVPLKDLERVRNRITHPKKLSDLNISADEVNKTRTVALWFLQNISELLKKGGNHLLPERITKFSPAKRLNLTKNYFTVLPDGSVYQFATSKQAWRFTDLQSLPRRPMQMPIVYRTEDLDQTTVPG